MFKNYVFVCFMMLGVLAGCIDSGVSKTETAASTSESDSRDSSVGERDVQEHLFSINEQEYSLTVPANWQVVKEQTGFNPAAEIVIEKTNYQAYYMLIEEEKASNLDFAGYLELVRQELSGGERLLTETVVTVNGLAGVRLTWMDVSEELEVKYLIDVLESDKHFVQSIGWLLQRDVLESEPELISLMDSLKEK